MRSQGAGKGIRNETFIAAVKFFHLEQSTEPICSNPSRISYEKKCSDSAGTKRNCKA